MENLRLLPIAKRHGHEEKLDEHQLNQEKLQEIITSISSYEDDENPYGWMISQIAINLEIAKALYEAWIDEE